MGRREKLFERKKIIVFAYEGKNNKTESQYFSHFSPYNDGFIIKSFPCGVTDPANMVRTAKEKRKRYDYHTNEDLTYIFVDGDCNQNKLDSINELRSALPKDIKIIVSNPCFELWILNHFESICKEFLSNNEFFKELDKHIKKYDKTKDYFSSFSDRLENAIANSKAQLKDGHTTFTEVLNLFEEKIIK